MVVSNSTKIGKRKAQMNAAEQQRNRAETLTQQATQATKAFDSAGNTQAGDRFANQANYFADQIQTPSTYNAPTNTLQPGINPSAQFNYETGQQKPLEQTGTMRQAFQEANDPRVRAILQARGIQEPTEARTRLQQVQDGLSNGTIKRYDDPGGVRFLGIDKNGNETTDVITSQEMEQLQNEVNQFEMQKTNAVNEADTAAQQQEQDQLNSIISSVPAEYQALIQQQLAGATSATQRIALAKQLANQAQTNANQDFNESQSQLTTMKDNNDAQLKRREELINKQAEDTQALLKEQERIQLDEQAIQEAQALQKAEQQKKQALFEMTNALALSGGFASAAGLGYLQSTEQKLNEHADYLKRSYEIDRRKIMSEFKADYLQIEQTADNNTAIALDKYDAQVEAINAFDIQTRQDKRTSELDAIKTFTESVDGILKDRDAAISKAVETSIGIMKEERSNKQKFAYDFFKDAFANSTDPMMRAKAVRLMASAGYDVSGIDTNAVTLDQQLKMLDIMTKQKALQENDVENFTDPKQREIIEAAYLAAQRVGGSDEYKQALISQVAGFLNRGDVKGAEERLRGMVASSFTGTLKESYDTLSVLRSEGRDAQDALNRIAANGQIRGFYSNTWSSLQKYLARSQDPEFLALSAELANISSSIIKERSGAAVTPAEMEQLQPFIPQPGDSVTDAMTKLKNLENFWNKRLNTMVDSGLGRVTPATGINSQQTMQYDNASIESIIFGTGTGGGSVPTYDKLGVITQGFSTPVKSREQGGLYNQSTVAAWQGKHSGIDIAINENTPLPSLVSGEVVEAGKQPGWGGTIVVKDSNGALHRLSHLNSVNVSVGDTVLPGQKLGLSGNTGNSTGAHLDYRIKVAGSYVDPLTYQYS